MIDLNKFLTLGLSENLTNKCENAGWTTPTEIQQSVIPKLLNNNDLIVLSETGSGKTGAFALPILEKLSKEPTYNFALIIAPTHELANQIKDTFIELSPIKDFRITTIFGGQSVKMQANKLRKGRYHIIVATPGRLVEHLDNKKIINFSNLKYLILDEADKMLSNDFMAKMKIVQSHLPKERITCLFSATMTNKLDQLEELITGYPMRVDLTIKKNQVPKNLQQLAIPCIEDIHKFCYLVNELRPDNHETMFKKHKKIILFAKTRDETKIIGKLLKNHNIPNIVLNGDLCRAERRSCIELFNAGCRILISTDVAGRGLDLPDVTCVINYNLPNKLEEYLHRVGRTARAGRVGDAVTLLAIKEMYNHFTFMREMSILMDMIEPDVAVVKEITSDIKESVRLITEDVKNERQELFRRAKIMKRRAEEKKSQENFKRLRMNKVE